MDDDDLIDAWCNSQTLRGFSPKTLARRRSTVRRFHASLGGARFESARGVEVERWLASLAIKPQSRGMYLSDLAMFYRWGMKHDHFLTDPTVKVDQPKRPNYLPRPIPTAKLKDAISRAPARQRLMLSLAGYAGLRASEIAGLRYEDIDAESGMIRVKGKGNKVRLVPLHPMIEAQLDSAGEGAVMQWRGKPISGRAVSLALSTYLRGAGVEATGHQARHSFGTRLYAETQDLAATQEAMGHASPTTTRGYVAHDPKVSRRGILALD